MKKILLAVALVLMVHSSAYATWSVIALNSRTGEVIIASATCVREEGFPRRQANGQAMAARDLMDIQAVVVPGIGVAACQAGVDNTRQNQMLVYNELKKGTPPPDILKMLQKDPNIERRQFGILEMPNGKTITSRNNNAGFNGTENGRSSLFYEVQVGDMYCQVQGNTLLGRDVVYKAALAFTRATGSMADRVMAAMGAADANGGDHRCNCGTNPLEFVPCDNMTAHVAYILIAEKGDELGQSFNDGKYYAYLSVTDDENPKTGIKPGESANPVKTLRMRYNAWEKAGAPRLAPPPASLYQPKGQSTGGGPR
jgi:uncharacterized Ntn-hydrolase superfamily protein